MIESPLTERALVWACDRIEDFYFVQRDGEWADIMRALSVLKESLGITEEIGDYLTTWADEFLEDNFDHASLLLGLMLGLIAADRQHELGS